MIEKPAKLEKPLVIRYSDGISEKKLITEPMPAGLSAAAISKIRARGYFGPSLGERSFVSLPASCIRSVEVDEE
jgi:hypothetical protein